MKIAQKSLERLKDILKRDKENISQPMLNMIKSDIYNVVNAYLDVKQNDVNIKYFINEDGFYEIDLKIKTKRIKKVQFFNI